MSATRCKPIQQVVDASTQTLAKCGKSAAMVRLRQELSLTDLNIKTAVARTRAFGKWANLRTWISDLINQWQALRADILAQYINIYRAQVATKPPILPASISMRLVGKLLGEELKLSSTRICKDPTVLCVKTTLATAKFLNAISLPRYLMLNSIRLAPIPPNQCPPGTETLVSQRRVNR
ncbi:hypothetical protein BB561_000195 [Smittium simulii]|uniref:Uncharacterized protein n=1 Tax=Smittium simulii TaxID=133385 RepID=A0A2T9Z006_9FUNG|nr:hypothetical protein BB561_000195 [Smittium simulii]